VTRIEVLVADITTLTVDVIVNAANPALAGGGGVDGAIHRAAGVDLLRQACRPLGGCPTGEVRMTAAFRLPARAIFHTVGPVWRGGAAGEPDLLAACYSRCLRLAEQHHFASIAFPAISCGVYGYPPVQAVAIAVATVRSVLPSLPGVQRVIFCCFDESMAARYRQALSARPPLS
jgi:O-acetyl-ADP-ribose deacetylase (regulator of RNase III)